MRFHSGSTDISSKARNHVDPAPDRLPGLLDVHHLLDPADSGVVRAGDQLAGIAEVEGDRGRPRRQRGGERLLLERPGHVIDRERAVGAGARSRRHCSSSSGTGRTAVPRLPRAPARQTAAASSTESHGPNGAAMTGTSMPSTTHSRVRGGLGEPGDGAGVPERVRELGVGEVGEHLQQRVEPVGRDDHRDRLGVQQVGPAGFRGPAQQRLAGRAERVGHPRVVRLAAPGPDRPGRGRVPAPAGPELGVPGQHRDPGRQRDRLAGQPGRVAGAVPAFEAVPERGRHAGAELQSRGQQPGGLAVRPQRRVLRRPQVGRAGRAALLLRVAHDVRPDRDGEGDLVTGVRRDLGRVRGAAQVAQQADADHLGAQRRIEAEPAGQPVRDQRAPDRVAERLAHAEVGCQRERGQHLDHPYRLGRAPRRVHHASLPHPPGGGAPSSRAPTSHRAGAGG
jgi:hypothetical protein